MFISVTWSELHPIRIWWWGRHRFWHRTAGMLCHVSTSSSLPMPASPSKCMRCLETHSKRYVVTGVANLQSWEPSKVDEMWTSRINFNRSTCEHERTVPTRRVLDASEVLRGRLIQSRSEAIPARGPNTVDQPQRCSSRTVFLKYWLSVDALSTWEQISCRQGTGPARQPQLKTRCHAIETDRFAHRI